MQKNTRPVKMCDVCGEPLETIRPYPKGDPQGYLIMSRPCKCVREAWETERIFAEHIEKMERARDILRAGYLDENYAIPSFDLDDGKNKEQMVIFKQYCENWKDNKEKNIGFFLFGPTDTGKTFIACSIANYVRNVVGNYVLIGSSLQYIDEMTRDYKRYKQDLISKVRGYPLMVIDDLGVEAVNQNNISVLEEIIDTRYEARKPLIITSNYRPNVLYEKASNIAERTKSRLSGMCEPKLVTGVNRRKEQFKERYSSSAMSEQLEWGNK